MDDNIVMVDMDTDTGIHMYQSTVCITRVYYSGFKLQS